MKRKLYLLIGLGMLSLEPIFAMHIMEGYLPLKWCLFWYAVSLPFVVWSYRAIRRQVRSNPRGRIIFALNAAFVFVLSALKLPSVTGSSSHLTGTTLGTLSSGIAAMPLIGTVVLIFQAILLAHGGIGTLGANIFSLSIAGPTVAYLVYKGLSKLGIPVSLSIFLATFLGSLSTYLTTSVQLAIVFPDSVGGVWGAFAKFASIFAITQVPLSIIEGFMTVGIVHLLGKTSDYRLIGEPTRQSQTAQISRKQTVIFSLSTLVCLILPLMAGYIDFGGGTDDAAGEMVETLAPHFDASPLIEFFEPSEAMEPWLFTLQVALGVGLFMWGYHAIRHSSSKH